MKRKIFRTVCPVALVILMAGCGGGGGGSYFPPVAGTTTPPATSNPPAQTELFDKFVAYVKALIASAVDAAEPADVSAFDPPPTSETREAIATQ